MFRAKPTNPPGRMASGPGAHRAQTTRPRHEPRPRVLPKRVPAANGGLPLPAHGRPRAGHAPPAAGGIQGHEQQNHRGGKMQHGA